MPTDKEKKAVTPDILIVEETQNDAEKRKQQEIKSRPPVEPKTSIPWSGTRD